MLTDIDNTVTIHTALLCWDQGCQLFFQNDDTKFRIYQIYLHQKFKVYAVLRLHLLINSCCWALSSYGSCKLNFYFPNFSSDKFISPWKIKPSTICYCIFISFVDNRILMQCRLIADSCFAVCNFLFAQFAEGIGLQPQQILAFQAMQTLSLVTLL